MKVYNDSYASFCITSLLLLITANHCNVVSSASQIIGSSVVTSVSVVRNDEKKNSPTPTPTPPAKSKPAVPSTPYKSAVTSRPDAQSGDEGVLSVIATLKSIVEKEQKKHNANAQKILNTNSAQFVDDDPSTPKTSKANDDGGEDDEADDGITSTSTKTVDTAEKETTTSVEVHAAIHRISGALLKPGKKATKPIENILTDVMTSINGARNGTGRPHISTTIVPKMQSKSKNSTKSKTQTTPTTTTKPKKSSSGSLDTAPTMKPTMRTTTKPVTVKTNPTKPKIPSSTTPGTVKTTAASPSPIKVQNKQTSQEPQIGTTVHHVKLTGIQIDSPEDTEEDLIERGDITTLKYKLKPTSRPKPPRPQYTYSAVLTSGRNNASMVLNTRPAEFYDDEIFGYDPYQTFLHGVYVPIVDIDPNAGIRDALPDPVTTTCKTDHDPVVIPQRRPPGPPPFHKPLRDPELHPHQSLTQDKATQKPSTLFNIQNNQKPVPNLPDHLYRPRPSHLQYQHTAAESVDTETGQVAVKVPHPGEKYSNPDENFAPDRLNSIPRPILGANVVKNLTDHHHAAHHGHGNHGAHPNHGNGDHGAHPNHGNGDHGAHPNHGNGDHAAHPNHGHGDHVAHPNHVTHRNHSHGDHSTHSHHTGHPVGENTHDPHPQGHHHHHHHHQHKDGPPENRPTFDQAPNGNPGLEATITDLDPEMRSFVDINNKIALRLFGSLTNPVSKSSTSYNNMVFSPFTIISSLGMLFLGARGSTAAQLDALLKMDDMLTFNPHMMYYNITQSFLSQSNTAAAVIRLLIADKQKGDVLDFFKTRVQHFYDTRVEEADYKFAGHLAQSIINQMIRAQIQRHSYEMLNYSLPLKGPMSLITAAFFDGQFSGARDSTVVDMHFIHLAALGRRLIQIPAVSLRGPMRAAYDTELDATAVEVPYSTRDLSLILLMPGRPGEFAIGGVTSLKSRLTLESWTHLMREFYPRESFKIVFPRFRHQTAMNLSYTMQRFGLTDMFQPHLAKFKGINGLNDLYLDQNTQHFSEFGTWEKLSDTLSEANLEGNKKFDLVRILRPQVRERYGSSDEPLTINDWIFKSRSPTLSPRYSNWQSYQPFFSYSRVRSSRNGRRQPRSNNNKVYYYRQDPGESVDEEKVLRFERPFLYVLRHNPTGMILMTGQYSEPVVEE